VALPNRPVEIRFFVGVDPSGGPTKSAGGNTIPAGGHTETLHLTVRPLQCVNFGPQSPFLPLLVETGISADYMIGAREPRNHVSVAVGRVVISTWVFPFPSLA
jgi:hypothetical protein